MMNTGKHIAVVVARTTCKKHKATNGEPCWTIYFGSSDGWGWGVCKARIVRAGFVGKITSASTRRGGSFPNKTKPTTRYSNVA